MRLFVSILPDEQMIRELVRIQDDMQRKGIRGRFTDSSSLHMTLVFIGEYGDYNHVLDILEETPFEPCSLKIASVMKFHDLYVCAFEENRELTSYVKRLHKAFSDHGIPFDRKSFFPHITLLRKAVDLYGIYTPSEINDVRMNADAISLMRSTLKDTGAVYSEIGRIAYDEYNEPEEETVTGGAMAAAKEMGRIWNLSADTVTALCRAGMIPSAEKEKGRWNIPSDAPKPPCTAYMAVKYLKNIAMIQEGASVQFSLYRKSTEELVDSFEYLKAIGFLKDFRWKSTPANEIDFNASLKEAGLTSEAVKFIASMETGEDSSERNFEASLSAKTGGGKIPAEVSGEVKYSSKNKK